MKLKRTILIVMVLGVTMGCGLMAGGSSNEVNQPSQPNTPDTGNSGADSASGDTGGSSGLFLPVNADITLSTPESGNGSHPLFRWDEVSGADLYQLYLFDPEGGAYWAWEGTATEIYLGGFDTEPDPDVDGPILLEPMEWAVVAVTEDGTFLASSKLTPVAP